jgi:hypothetical protein
MLETVAECDFDPSVLTIMMAEDEKGDPKGPPGMDPKPGPPGMDPKPGPPGMDPKPGPPGMDPKPGPPDMDEH